MQLNTLIHDGPGEVPLLIAHGLYGSARNWNVIGKRLSDARKVIAVDMRNHGDSPHHPDHSYPALARDLAEVIDRHGGRADVLGHSMGGKAAMVLALQNPDRIRQLIVADIAPVTYSHSQLQVAEALLAVNLAAVNRRSDADAALAEHIDDKMLRAFLLQSLVVGPDQPARWKLALQTLAEQMPLIMSFPATVTPNPLQAVFLRGGASDYVNETGQQAALNLFPNARIQTMDGLGHWLHAEDPRGFEARVRAIEPGA